MNEGSPYITRAEIADVIRRTVVATLEDLGVDASTAEARQEMQRDHAYVRRARVTSEEMPKHLRRAGLALGLTLVCTLLWMGAEDAIKELVVK